MAIAPEQLIEQAARHQVYLEGQKTHSVNDVLELMQEMEDKIISRLSRSDITMFNKARLERLLDAVNGFMDDYYDGAISELWRKQLDDLAVYEAGFEVRSLDNVVVNYDFDLPSDTQIISSVYTNPLTMRGPDNGKLLESFYADWTQNQKDRVSGAIRAGFAMGDTTPQIVRQLMQEDFKINRRTMSTLVRTGLQHASSHARQITWERNDDIVKQVQWVSVIDSRTSVQCRSLDGQKFPINKGPRPPAHAGCRSSTVAVLDESFSFLEDGATRSAREPDGDVTSIDANTTYYSWLKKQPASFQDSVIGPTRGKLLRNGGLTSARFAELQLNKNFQPLTIDEMRKLEPVAFEKANI